jgi:hypothetical protein
VVALEGAQRVLEHGGIAERRELDEPGLGDRGELRVGQRVEPAGERRWQHLDGELARGTARAGTGARGDVRGELGDRRVLEQIARGDREAEAASGGDDLQRDERVTAEREEVVVDAEAGAAEPLRPQLAERLLDGIAGRDVGGAGLVGRCR